MNICYDNTIVVNAKALSVMRYQDDINTDHNVKSIGRAAVAQWTKRLTHTMDKREFEFERRTFLILHNISVLKVLQVE